MSAPTETSIIGLGSMGLGMARNAISAGIPMRGYDISETARKEFADAGGLAADTAETAAAGARLLVLMVVNAAQAEDVLFGAGHAAEALPEAATVMLSSTVAPSEARALGKRLAAMGLDMLDAPVSGGKVGAEAGTLTIMASGSDAAFAVADPFLRAVSKQVHHLGEMPGMGATYKVVHQLAAGVHLAAAAELMALGAAAGCDPDKLFEIVSTSAGQSWMFNDRVPRMLSEDARPTSMVDIFIKDLGLVLQTGRENKAPLPLSAAAHQMFLGASALGYGEHDDSAVVRAYETLTGRPLRP